MAVGAEHTVLHTFDGDDLTLVGNNALYTGA